MYIILASFIWLVTSVIIFDNMKVISDTISKAVQDMGGTIDFPITLTRPEPQFGDFSSNIAMQLSKQLQKNPREIAEQIAQSRAEAKAGETYSFEQVETMLKQDGLLP